MPPRNGCHYAASNISMNGGPVGDPTNHNTDFAALAGTVRRGQVHTNSIEGTWAHLKLSLQAIYMGVSQKHLQHYCAKFAFHYNRRAIDDGARFTDWFGSCRGHLAYKTLIAD